MNRTARTSTIIMAVGIAVGTLGTQGLVAQQAPVTRTILQQKDLDGVAGREVIMYRADLAPAAVAGKHLHPGPELFYVLEGALIVEREGLPPVTIEAEQASHIAAREIHNVRNASGTGPAKALVFMVGEKGQPLTTLVK